jgi:hypothetical protein
MKPTDKLLEAADMIDKFCEFINPDFYEKTIFYSRELAKLMREAAKQEYPPYFVEGVVKTPPPPKRVRNIGGGISCG